MAVERCAPITTTSAPDACVKATSNHRSYSRLGEGRKDAAAMGKDPGFPVALCYIGQVCPPGAFPAGIKDLRQRNGQVHTNQQAGFTPCSADP